MHHLFEGITNIISKMGGSASREQEQSTPDQKERFAKAKEDKNDRVLDIDKFYEVRTRALTFEGGPLFVLCKVVFSPLSRSL